jgi:subfamily B ATP-binding cassette protein HlyB/CyaB
MQILRRARALAWRLRGQVGRPGSPFAVGWERPVGDAEFEWILGALAAGHGLAFDPRLLASSFPAPRTRGDLLAAAKALGIDLEPLRLEPARLRERAGPCVAFAREPAAPREAAASAALILTVDAHELVVAEFGASEPRCLGPEEFASGYQAVGLATASLDDIAGPQVEQPAAAGRFGFRWFVPELLRHRAVWRDVLLASLLIQLLGLAMPLLAQVVIDKVVVHRTLGTLGVVTAAAFLFVVFGAAMSWVRQYLLIHTGNRIDAVLGQRVFSHLLRLSPRYFESRATGSVVARLHGIEVVREFLSGAGVGLMLDLPFVLVFLAVMLAYSWELTIVAVAGLALLCALALLVSPLLRARLDQQFRIGAANQAFVTEHVGAMATAKILQMEGVLERRYGDQLARLLEATFRTRTLSNTYQVGVSALEQAMSLVILLAGAMLVMRAEGFTIGMLVAFQMFASRMSQPVLRLAALWQDFQQARVAVERLGDLMDGPQENYAARPRRAQGGAGVVRFEAVDFRYGPRHPWLLRRLSFALAPGGLTVVIGPSGTGKSTIVRLLLGFEQPEAGRILVDDVDTAWMAANELRALFGVVPQDTTLFSGTILRNLLDASPGASFEDIVNACRLAEVHADIEALPQGYDTPLGEQGVGLSGGQRQRIAIARALLRRPRVLVFDEATSHLDGDTAAAFARTVNALRGKVTMLFIAHVLPRGLMVDQVVRLSGPGLSSVVSPVSERGAMPAGEVKGDRSGPGPAGAGAGAPA